MRAVTLTLLMTVATLGPGTFSAVAEDEEGAVYTTGTVVTRVAPDMIQWRIGSTETDTVSVAAAKAKSDAVMQGLLAAIRELNPESADVQTGMIHTEKVYARDEHGREGEFKHYAVRRSISFVQKDLSRFDEVFEGLVNAGNVEVNFSFASSQREELLRSTRLRAVETAREKACAMCETAGAKLGKPLWLSEYPPEGRRENQNYSWSNNGMDFVSAPSEDVSEGSLAPGVLDIRVTVYAIFEIE